MKSSYPILIIFTVLITLHFNYTITTCQNPKLPLLDINKTTFDYGRTKYNMKKSNKIIFKNIGDTNLTIYNIDSPANPFSANFSYPLDLKSGDSAIFEINYQPLKAARDSQRIYLRADTRLSHSIALLFDISKSMNQEFNNENITKLQAAINAGKNFINSMLSTPSVWDEAAIFSFSNDFYTYQDFTTDKTALINALPKFTLSGTWFYKGCIAAIEKLKFRPYQKVLIALSDGEDKSTSNFYTAQSVIDSAKKNNIQIYTVGIGSQTSDNTLRNIANQTGGLFFKATSSKQLNDIYFNIFNLLSKNIQLHFDILGICDEPVLEIICNNIKFATPGDTISFPVLVHAIATQDAINQNYTLTLNFNKTLLYPLNSGISYSNNENIILDSKNLVNLDSLPLTELKFITLLGNSDCTDITIESLSFNHIPEKIIPSNSACKVCLNSCVRQIRQVEQFFPTSLYQNLPNPFSDITDIKFYAANNGRYMLDLYNEMGVLVINLLDNQLNSGSYSFKLNACHLPTGIYYYILKTPETIISKKMFILK